MSDKPATEAERLKLIQLAQCTHQLQVFVRELERLHGQHIVALAMQGYFNEVSKK